MWECFPFSLFLYVPASVSAWVCVCFCVCVLTQIMIKHWNLAWCCTQFTGLQSYFAVFYVFKLSFACAPLKKQIPHLCRETSFNLTFCIFEDNDARLMIYIYFEIITTVHKGHVSSDLHFPLFSGPLTFLFCMSFKISSLKSCEKTKNSRSSSNISTIVICDLFWCHKWILPNWSVYVFKF